MPSVRLSSRALARGLLAVAVGLVALGFWDLSAEAKGKKGGKGTFEYGCRVQAPQKFLERRSFMQKGGVLDVPKQQKALRYLAEHYGNAGGDTVRLNPRAALTQAKGVRFMGLPLSVHTKIAPALACVEKRIEKTCTGASHYKPRAVGGFRGSNTYRGIEVSNHLFGVAIDIDPDKNPCCGCVDPWPNNPLCKKEGSVWVRTAMPKCWIRSFEHFGFDWLGHDSLEDTMHFEFLGDPDRITR
jgi:hypothetical protein